MGVVGTGAGGEVGAGGSEGVVGEAGGLGEVAALPLGLSVVGPGERVVELAFTVIGSAAHPLDAALLLTSPE